MPSQIKTTIARTSDGDCIRALSQILTTEVAANFSKYHYAFPGEGATEVPRNDFDTNPSFVQWKECKGRSFYRLGIKGDDGTQVTVVRDLEKGSLVDILEINPGGQNSRFSKPIEFAKLAEIAQQAFIQVPSDLRSFVGDAEASRAEANEVMLARLEGIAGIPFRPLRTVGINTNSNQVNRENRLSRLVAASILGTTEALCPRSWSQ